MPEVIACFTVLHNIALQNGDIVKTEVGENNDDAPPTTPTIKLVRARIL